MSNETKQELQAFERYKIVVEILKELNDSRGLKLIQELVDKCARYIDIASIAEAHSKMLRSGNFAGGEGILDVQRASENLDRNRKLAHDALISQLIIVNRYISSKKDIPLGGIYSLDPRTLIEPYEYDSRVKIGDWAKYLTNALERRGIRKTN